MEFEDADLSVYISALHWYYKLVEIKFIFASQIQNYVNTILYNT